MVAAMLWLLPRLVARGQAVWIGAWLGAGGLTLLLGLARRFETLTAQQPFASLTAGRSEFGLYAPAILLLLGLPAIQLPRKQTRWACAALGAVAIWSVSLAPFVQPLVQGAPVSFVDRDGVCLQADSYNCGPASAVTILRRLGFQDAELPSVSAAAHTSAAIGTPPDLLCDAIERLYPLRARVCYPASVDELPPGRSLVVLKLGLFVDHYVALLEVQPDRVWVGDPLAGRVSITRSDLAARWRGTAIVLERRAQ